MELYDASPRSFSIADVALGSGAAARQDASSFGASDLEVRPPGGRGGEGGLLGRGWGCAAWAGLLGPAGPAWAAGFGALGPARPAILQAAPGAPAACRH